MLNGKETPLCLHLSPANCVDISSPFYTSHCDCPWSNSAELSLEDSSERSSGRSSMSSSQQSTTPRRLRATVQSVDSCDYAEVASSPSHIRWALKMRYLLEDGEGVQLFKQFLEQESATKDSSDAASTAALDFWFACQGFKNNVHSEDIQKIYQLIKIIYRTYVRGATALRSITQATRRRIGAKLAQKSGLDQSIFDEAQMEVEKCMRSGSYLAFLKSDLYTQFLASGGKAPIRVTATEQVGAISVNLDVDEDCLNLEGEKLCQSTAVSVSSTSVNEGTTLTRCNLAVFSVGRRQLLSCRTSSRRAPTDALSSELGITWPIVDGRERLPNLNHASYTRVSAQNALLQSLSSDAFTENTISDTDSSIDGGKLTARGRVRGNKQLRLQQCRASEQNAVEKREIAARDAREQFIMNPRTEKLTASFSMKQQRNLILTAEQNPREFARALHDKLNALLLERDNLQRMNQLLMLLETESDRDSGGGGDTSAVLRAPWAGRLIAAAQQATETQDAQTILEDHCGRVWERSENASPMDDRARSPRCLRRADGCVVDSMISNTERHHIHHYHYHHYPPAQEHDSFLLSTNDEVSSGRNGQYKPTGPPSDVDSGVSVIYDQIDSPKSCSTQKLTLVSSVRPGQKHDHMTSSTSPTQAALEFSVAASAVDPCPQLDDQKPRFESILGEHCNFAEEGCELSSPSLPNLLIVGYYLCGDPVPYRCTWQGTHITLAQFKQLIAKKGNYRYFFKTLCNDFENGVVHEEVSREEDVLPLWEGKVVARIERVDV